MKEKIAVQLYTLRDECAADFPGVLREISQMGYAGVQFAGFHGHEPKALKSILDETGLKAAGLHVGLQELLERSEEVAAAAEALGTVDVICPSLPAAIQNEAGYRQLKRDLNELASRWSERGLRLSYHNHAFEFETTLDGKDALSFLLEPAADNGILAELDVYWLRKGGQDPVAFFEPYAGRMPIVHMKDMTDDAEGAFAPIGTGVIDFDSILEWGEASGVEWYVVEQDSCKTDPMECVRTSYGNLLGMMEKRAANRI